MKNPIKTVVEELSSRKVEWSSKQRIKINLFEEELDPGIKINSFVSVNQYRRHLAQIYEEFKIYVETEVSLCHDFIMQLLLLEDYMIFVLENKHMHLPSNSDFIFYSFEFNIPTHQKNINEESKKKTAIFHKCSA